MLWFFLCCFLQLPIGAENFPKRDEDEDGVEGGEYHKIDEGIHVEEAAISGHELDSDGGENNDRHHPPREVPPSAEDFFFHPVGDEGEQENNSCNRKNY